MRNPHAQSVEEALRTLSVDPAAGLDEREVRRRRRRHGLNRLSEAKTASVWKILVDQFRSLVIGILALAAVLSFAMTDVVQGAAIIAAILVNAIIGFVTEWRAVRSMEALRKLGTVRTRVRRAGETRVVDAEALVPGDVVLLEAGDMVTADLRVTEANDLSCDESALTGESVPVTKTTEPAETETPLAERASLAFKGTAVTAGSGAGVVVATGMTTELGAIARMTEAAEEETTPLEKRLDRLARRLIVLTLIVAVVIAGIGYLGGKDIVTMVKTAVALAVAAVPEGLPIVATVALARGMWRMARRNALVERLAAVETLGSTNVVFTDKTGTLTENRMAVARLRLAEKTVDWRGWRHDDLPDGLRRLLEVAVLCNNASLSKHDPNGPEPNHLGDPMEVALLVAGKEAGIDRTALLERYPEIREEAFSAETKMMATVHEADGGVRVAVKGAPEAVLKVASRALSPDGEIGELDEEAREAWTERVAEMAGHGLRVLAFAERTAESADADPYETLTLLGLIGLADPPREDAIEAVARCRGAGIRVIMVTGDLPVTAESIAAQVGLSDGELRAIEGAALPDLDTASEEDLAALRERLVFARVSPGQKLDLVRLWQSAGAVVAMTGDGVNDAPALKKADVGIAMGRRGTDVARQAADIVLKDDAFATIVTAIEQGRAIFDNIRRFIVFLLSGNLAEILAIGLAAGLAAPLPLLPLQILFINLVLDVFPALALGVGEGAAGIMDRPPRDPREPVLARRHWSATVLWGIVIALAASGVFFAALGPLAMAEAEAVTVAFLTFGLARLWHVFNMRGAGTGLTDNEVVRNPWVWRAIALCLVLLAAAVWLPGLHTILGVSAPSATGWALILGGSLVPVAVGQTVLSALPSSPAGETGRNGRPADDGPASKT